MANPEVRDATRSRMNLLPIDNLPLPKCLLRKEIDELGRDGWVGTSGTGLTLLVGYHAEVGQGEERKL